MALRVIAVAVLAVALGGVSGANLRINHAGRILGAQQAVSSVTLFNTATADAVMSTIQLMPRTNSWNEDISGLAVAANSDAIVRQTNASFAADRRYLRPEYEMNFQLVPANQSPLVDITMLDYPDESDQVNQNTGVGSYPFQSSTLPIESWPRNTGSRTLVQHQTQCRSVDDGDCHAIIFQPDTNYFWETWHTQIVSGAWQASNSAWFNITSNALRAPGITSGDAGGLPMLPSLVRYDECQRGVIEHALRLVVFSSRGVYYYPANHKTGSNMDPSFPAMGQRFRLKSSFVAPASWTKCEKAVVAAFQKYGGIVADNGGFFSFSITPDDRYAANEFQNLKKITLNQFEVVNPSLITATSGPRSAGAFTVSTGADPTIGTHNYVTLTAAVTPSTGSYSYAWSAYAYPGTSITQPGTVTFNNPTFATTDVAFSADGTYTLIVKVSDGVHTPAYSVVYVTVSASSNGGNSGPLPTAMPVAPTGGSGTGSNDDLGAAASVHANALAVVVALILSTVLSVAAIAI